MPDEQPKYLAIKNWEKYQHMQHGKPAPWCRLYAGILDDEAMLGWTLTELGVWVKLLALRTRLGRNLPNDHRKLVRMLSEVRNQARSASSIILRRISDGFLIPCNQQNNEEHSGVTPAQRRVETETETEKNPLPPSGDLEAFQLPDWLPKEAWDGFIEMRKSIHKPLKTQRAIQLAIKKLETLKAAGHDPAEVLNQSTMNGWQGLFELKGRRNGPGLMPVAPAPEKPKTREQIWEDWQLRMKVWRREYPKNPKMVQKRLRMEFDDYPQWLQERVKEYMSDEKN